MLPIGSLLVARCLGTYPTPCPFGSAVPHLERSYESMSNHRDEKTIPTGREILGRPGSDCQVTVHSELSEDSKANGGSPSAEAYRTFIFSLSVEFASRYSTGQERVTLVRTSQCYNFTKLPPFFFSPVVPPEPPREGRLAWARN